MEELKAEEKKVLELIPRSERRLPIADLSKLTGIQERYLYDIIGRLRSYGIPVLASRNRYEYGYYIATSQDELSEGIAPYKRQAQNMKMTIQFLENADLEHWQDGIKK